MQHRSSSFQDHDGSSLLNNSERNGHDDPMQNMVNADELVGMGTYILLVTFSGSHLKPAR